VVRTRGSTPQVPGASLLLRGDMESEGTLGGGCVEAEVRQRAYAYLRQNESGVLDFVLDHDFGWDDGLICGGRMDIAVMTVSSPDQLAPFEQAADDLRAHRRARVPLRVRTEEGLVEYRLNVDPAPRLIIAGGGHVGLAVARLCGELDFNITVIDDREKFANAERFGPDVDCRVGPIDEILAGMALDEGCFIVIVTRGHIHDERALKAVVGSSARYIGMIGSRRKIKLILDDLREAGVGEELLQRVHAPIGLPIGAVTVREIAVSIAAELIQVRRARQGPQVEGPVLVAAEASP
jgi:xanthine dehydrogenase accessory factor